MSIHQQLWVPLLTPEPVFEPPWLITPDMDAGISLIQSSMACASAFHQASSAPNPGYGW